jgi:tetratricopeptide (TPR) repeat protein
LRTVESFLVMPLLVVTLGFLAPVSLAQGKAPSKAPNSSQQANPQPASSPQQSPSPESNNTRASGAAPASPSPKPGENQTTATSADAKVVSDQESVPSSKPVTLRDEINAAPNEQARARLQLKLVEQLVAAGMKQEAIAELKAMSDEDRFNPQGLYNIGNAQARLGEAEGAINSYRKAIEQRKGRYSRASNNLGVVLLRWGLWDEAFEAFMSALRQESFRYAEASYNLGRLYAARGEGDLAVREWRRAVAVDPEHQAAAKALAGAGRAANITVAGRARWSIPNKRSKEERPTASTAKSKSSRIVSRALRSFTVDPDTYNMLQRARAARDQGRNDAAVVAYRQVLARTGGYFPPANLELSYALIALKRNDEAISTLLPVTLKDGNSIPISHYHLARLYESRGELKLAENHYSRAAEAYGENNNQFILDVGRVREKQGNLAGALMSLEQYVSGMERQGQKPEWSDQRLTALRQKLAASPPKP